MNLDNYRKHLAKKIVDTAKSNGLKIFGSYVRESLSGRELNLDDSDIDIFAPIKSANILKRYFETEGMYIKDLTPTDNIYTDDDKHDFKLYKTQIGLVNDVLFTGSEILINVDIVSGCSINDKDIGPSFGCLDFECNGFIWDAQGINFSRNTGTHIDNMSDIELKHEEIRIIKDLMKKRTLYIPMPELKYASEVMDPVNIFYRKKRVNRIIKLLKQGWTISNLNAIKMRDGKGKTCLICLDPIEGDCVDLNCCTAYYHPNCFVEYAQTELEERSYIRCVQRCNGLVL